MYIIKKLKSIKIFLFIFCIIFSQATNFPQSTKSYKILGISVVGNKTADITTIIANSGLKVGNEIQIPGDQTINAIKQLWSLNIFSDVQILIEKEMPDGIFLQIKIEEYPRLEKFVFEGNHKIDDNDLEKLTNLIRGQILKPQEVQRIKQRILDKYSEKGYLNAEINTKYFTYFTADTSKDKIRVIWRNEKDLSEEYTVQYKIKDEPYSNLIDRIKDRILVMYDIKENEQVKVKNIVFFDNNAFDDSELRGKLKNTKVKKWFQFWRSSKFKKDKYEEEDKSALIDFYRENGYRDAFIVADSLSYVENKEKVELYITVYEGPQYKIRNIEWEGNTIYPDKFLTERLGIEKGSVYNYKLLTENLRGNKQQSDISSLYLDNGYLTFNLKTIEKKVAEDSVDILIQINERNQFRVGKVDITGNDKTKDKVIRRELYTVPGDYFNRSALFRSLQQLANLQYFNAEKLYTEGVDYQLVDDSTVNVAFKVEEKSSDYLNASVGYSGSFGFSGAVGVTLTNFSIAEPFSLGGGQILSLNWQFGVGSLYRTISLSFTEPWMFNTPTLLGFDFFNTRQQYVYDLSQTGGSVRVGRRLKWPDDYFYVQGLFRYQRNNIIDGGGWYREGKSQQFTLGATISRRDVDNPVFPSIGSSIALDGEISGGPFLPGDVDYFKVQFKTEWYKRLFNTNKLVLFTSSDLGYLKEIVGGTPIDPFEYFYMGGNGLVIATTPLRGYDDRTVGPINPKTGEVYGGRFLTKFTAELRFAVSLEPIPLYLLTFVEAGNVFPDLENTNLYKLRRAAGFGARIMMAPIGLLGFDLGYGFDRRDVDGKDPSWVFHFQFGQGR